MTGDTGAELDWRGFPRRAADLWLNGNGKGKQDRSRKRDQEILRAAVQVFARDGIARARIGDVAAEAGMAVSSIYEYYRSKEDLAYAVPIRLLGQFFAEFADQLHPEITAREALRLFLWLSADFSRRNPEWSRVLYLEVWPSVLVKEAHVRRCLDDYVRIIISILKGGVDAGEWSDIDCYQTSAILTGSMNQIIITWLLYRQPRNLMKAAKPMIDQLMCAVDLKVTPGTAEGFADIIKSEKSKAAVVPLRRTRK